MTPLSAALALLLASSLLALGGCTRQVELMASVPEADGNEVIAVLQDEGIHAQKAAGKDGAVSISVDADRVGRAVNVLRSKGLPRERFAGMGQVFRKDGLISSPLEERARYLYAISQELDATLSHIDGVILARVHVVLPERSAAGDPTMPSSASVFIKYQEGFNLEVLQPQIRRLVTNSVPGLTPEKVSIVLFSSQPLVRAAPAVTASSVPVYSALAALVGVLLVAAAYAVSRYWPQIKRLIRREAT
jgi:type III secretion protein J